jgi:hypothetical protein
MIVWQVTTYWYLSPFINEQDIPLRATASSLERSATAFHQWRDRRGFQGVAHSRVSLEWMLRTTTSRSDKRQKTPAYAQIVREPFVLPNLTSIESVNMKENLNRLVVSHGSQTGDDCAGIPPDTVEFEFVDSIVWRLRESAMENLIAARLFTKASPICGIIDPFVPIEAKTVIVDNADNVP